jgi:hypothetical protein
MPLIELIKRVPAAYLTLTLTLTLSYPQPYS